MIQASPFPFPRLPSPFGIGIHRTLLINACIPERHCGLVIRVDRRPERSAFIAPDGRPMIIFGANLQFHVRLSAKWARFQFHRLLPILETLECAVDRFQDSPFTASARSFKGFASSLKGADGTTKRTLLVLTIIVTDLGVTVSTHVRVGSELNNHLFPLTTR
jgi:hypothetical protein